jgi:hypothetical protein
MKPTLVLGAGLLLGLSLIGSAAADAPSAPPALVRLGQQLQLAPAQQPQWQAALDAAARARAVAQTGVQALASEAESELKKPDADLDRLSQLQQRTEGDVQAARAEARQAFLAFYAQATPPQQTAIRQFLLERVQRLQDLRALRGVFAPGT